MQPLTRSRSIPVLELEAHIQVKTLQSSTSGLADGEFIELNVYQGYFTLNLKLLVNFMVGWLHGV